MRRLREYLYAGLLLVGATFAFGNSGLGLALLWLEARRRREVSGPPPWPEVLATEAITFVHLSAFRVLFVAEASGRVEVFRDEVSARDWARVRRRCLEALDGAR